MDLIRGTICVQLLIQKFLQPPFVLQFCCESPECKGSLNQHCVCGKKSMKVNPNPLHFHNTPSKRDFISAKLIWILLGIKLRFLVAFALVRTSWILRNWQQIKDFEQIGYLTLVGSSCAMCVAAQRTITEHTSDICFYLSQIFKIIHHDISRPSGTRRGKT